LKYTIAPVSSSIELLVISGVRMTLSLMRSCASRIAAAVSCSDVTDFLTVLIADCP
jgi:hypothetical protein